MSTEWQEFALDFTVNDDQTYIRAPIHFSITSSQESVIYIDNLQITDKDFGKTPVIVEAETGDLGSNFSVQKDGDISYITTKVDYSGQTNPESNNSIGNFCPKGNLSSFCKSTCWCWCLW